ncbi:helix-turn-helix domain-containing protein [Vibrio cyclitrophicus]
MFKNSIPVDNFFGNYLKFLRSNHGLSQRELSVKLNLSSEELAHVDFVAVSRWERGIIIPSARRQVNILRTLTNDISPYIMMLAKASPVNMRDSQIENFINFRYKSPVALINNVSYRDEHASASIVKEIRFDDKEVILDICNFHYQLCSKLISNQQLSEYIKSNRVIGFKHIKEDGTLVGHKVFILWGENVLEKEINRLLNDDLSINEINIKLSKPMNNKVPLSCYAVSQYSDDEDTLRAQLYIEYSMLVKNVNIHHLYYNVFFDNAMKAMLNLGFNLVKVEGNSSNGKIIYNGKKYDRALLHINTCNLLLNPEFVCLFSEHKMNSNIQLDL